MTKITILFYSLIIINLSNYWIKNIYALSTDNTKSNEKILIVTHKRNLNNVKYREIRHYYSGIYFDFPISDNRSIEKPFYKKLLSKDMDEVKKMWGRILFSGKGDIPYKLSRDREVINWISENQNGIGYIKKKSFDSEILAKISEI